MVAKASLYLGKRARLSMREDNSEKKLRARSVNMLAVVTGHVALQQPPIMLNTLPILKQEYPGVLMSKVVSCVWKLVLGAGTRYSSSFKYTSISFVSS